MMTAKKEGGGSDIHIYTFQSGMHRNKHQTLYEVDLESAMMSLNHIKYSFAVSVTVKFCIATSNVIKSVMADC